MALENKLGLTSSADLFCGMSKYRCIFQFADYVSN